MASSILAAPHDWCRSLLNSFNITHPRRQAKNPIHTKKQKKQKTTPEEGNERTKRQQIST